ncbi:anti-sigma factor family protein [Brotaphodocola sp.]|uniref:anti-sigma factor family protein n=1 Tax=Brotaphodocola sp. TaxID=3073577 RepID=UPI003D7CB784
MTCREAEKLIMPFIDMKLDEEELEAFLIHVSTCPDCREELEIYYTVSLGLRQLDSGAGGYDIAGALEESLEDAWIKVRTARLRKVICYAVNTLCAAGVLTLFVMQLRIWTETGIL